MRKHSIAKRPTHAMASVAPKSQRAVQIALTKESTYVSVPNNSRALMGTGLALLGAGLLLAMLED